MTTETLQVQLAERTYPIHFSDSHKALAQTVTELRTNGRAICVIADEGVIAAQPTYLQNAGFQKDEILVLPRGETTKSTQHFAQCLSHLAAKALNRDSALFAFGGGVIGDLCGYVAASYLRGIDFYQIPTTLLSMVDSSVGGKTGINLPEGKNLVGAFWQPKAVYIDPNVLTTLPPREFAAGMAEVIKYGMLADKDFHQQLIDYNGLSPQSPELAEVIRHCCAIKAQVVAEDEKENAKSGGRALLNLGHTFAHAIENVAGYGQYLHGEAVAIGLKLATILSVQLQHFDTTTINEVEKLLNAYHLPTALTQPLPLDALMHAMSRDKKNRGGKLRFVTLSAIGSARTQDDIAPELIRKIWLENGASA